MLVWVRGLLYVFDNSSPINSVYFSRR